MGPEVCIRQDILEAKLATLQPNPTGQFPTSDLLFYDIVAIVPAIAIRIPVTVATIFQCHQCSLQKAAHVVFRPVPGACEAGLEPQQAPGASGAVHVGAQNFKDHANMRIPQERSF